MGKVNNEDRQGGFFLPPQRVIVTAGAEILFILTGVLHYNSVFLFGWGALSGSLEACGVSGDRFFQLN